MPEKVDRASKALAVGIVCWIASILAAGPSLNVVLNLGDAAGYDRFRDTFSHQVEDPFFRPSDHRWEGGFLGYRVLVPLIAKALGLGGWGGVGLIWIAGLLALALAFAYLAPILGARVAGLMTLALSMTAFSQASHVYIGYPDAVSHLLVMVMILWPSPLAWFLGVFAGMFNDERLLVSLPLALALVLHGDRRSVSRLLRASIPFAGSVLAALLLAWLVRKGILTGAIGGRPIGGHMYPGTLAFAEYGLVFYALGLLLSFGLLWVLPLRTAWAVSHGRDEGARHYWSAIAAYFAIAVLACSFVGDFWRSLASLFPLFLLAAIGLNEMQAGLLGRWLMPLVVAMVLLPKLEQMGPNIRWLRPLPVGIYEYQVGESVLSRLRKYLGGSG